MLKGNALGFFNIHSVAKYFKKLKGDTLETLKNFQKKSHKAESRIKGPGKVSVPKNWKGGHLCFAMVLYFMLEALDVFKIKY